MGHMGSEKMWDPDFFIIVLDNLHGESNDAKRSKRVAPFFWKAPCSLCRPETVLVNNDQVYIYMCVRTYMNECIYFLILFLYIEGVSLWGLNGFARNCESLPPMLAEVGKC